MDLIGILIWMSAIYVWWYAICTFFFVVYMRRSLKCYQEIITLLEGLPDEVYSDEFMWDHVQEVVSVHERMADIHKTAAHKWERRSNPVRFVRRGK